MKIKKGDTVKIISGKDRGKTGKVTRVLAHEGRISVEGVNQYKKHSRPKKQGEKGEMITITRPFAISNAQLLCASCGKGTRAGFRVEKDTKTRVCTKCGATL